MKVLFENVTEYSKEEMRKFAEFHQKNNKLFALYLFVCILLLLVLVILNILNKNWELICLLLAIPVIAYIYNKFFREKKEKARRKKIADKTFVFDFCSRLLTVHNKSTNEDTYVNYFEIKKVYETEYNFYLYMGMKNAYILNKECFTVGTLNNFRDFIKQKCMLKYRKKYKKERIN